MEVALYNKKGKPVAYIAEDGETVYLWDGNPVAYLYEDKVYGLNGKQLGWFTNGTVFDIYGLRAGFIKSKSPIITELDPPKTMKQMGGARKVRQPQVVKPVMCYGYSGKPLEELLAEGKDR
jgi:4-fold beta flower protein